MIGKVATWSALIVCCCWLTLVVASAFGELTGVEEHDIGDLHVTVVDYSTRWASWILPVFAVVWAAGIARIWQRHRFERR